MGKIGQVCILLILKMQKSIYLVNKYIILESNEIQS